MKKGQIVAVAVVLGIAATAAQAQVGVDVALSGAGVFSKSTNASTGSISDTPTKSVAVLGSVRYHFRERHAFELDLGHANNSQIFSVPPDTYRVTTGVLEYTGAYVFTPFSTNKWHPFLLAGGGGLSFGAGKTYIDTIVQPLGARRQLELAFLYGIGTDYDLWKHLGLRLQYRGLLYRNPDFGVPRLFYTGSIGHMAEPAFGFVAKF